VSLELKERLFGGSAKSLLLNLLEGEKFTKDDAEELKRAIQELETDE
jgi:predicted transcriptional regulator